MTKPSPDPDNSAVRGADGSAQPPPVAVLHIAKTGGTALREMAEAWNAETGQTRMIVLPHHFTLSTAIDEFPDAQFAFFIRDPLARLISGFTSRLRGGQPRYDVPHRPDEAAVFAQFPSIAAVADGLLSGDDTARDALRKITHAHRGFAYHLGPPRRLARHGARISFIGQTENFLSDVACFKRTFGVPSHINVPTDPVGRNATPDAYQVQLTAPQAAVLRVHLAQDYMIYGGCLRHPACVPNRISTNP